MERPISIAIIGAGSKYIPDKPFPLKPGRSFFKYLSPNHQDWPPIAQLSMNKH